MLRPEVIRKRLEKLDGYLNILENIRNHDRQAFLSNPEHYGSAERFLQLAIETINDMAAHVIAEGNLGVVNRNRDIPACLRTHGYIDVELEERWIRMIGFRNILVHEYLEVDREIVYETLAHNLADLRKLAGVFAQFL